MANTPSANRPARLLIVEDEYFVALNAQQLLENAGFIVTGIAASAEQALKLAKQDNPEIVLMDIRLHGVRDGIDAALDLRSTMNVPCIFVTSHAEAQIKERADPARPLGWVQKPYAERALIETINEALASLT
jgi:CheY-like chemotaxis protein